MGGQTKFSSVWKQENKTHKTGRHRSKGAVEVSNQGRVGVKQLSNHKKKHVMNKEERKNRQQQSRAIKRDQILELKRGIGKGNASPHLVLLLPLHCDVDVDVVEHHLKACASLEDVKPVPSQHSASGFTMNIPRFKYRFQVIKPQAASLATYLDYVQVVDTVVLVVNMNAEEPVDEVGEHVLKNLQSSGMSSYVFCGQKLQAVPMKKRSAVRAKTLKKLEGYASEVKLLSLDDEQEALSLLRVVSERKRKRLALRHQRSYMLTEKMEYQEEDGEKVLKLSGYVRGRDLDVNRLLHLVGWGSYQIKRVDRVAEPCPFVTKASLDASRQTRVDGMSYEAWQTIDSVWADAEKRQTLQSEKEVDPLEGEQTWPTAEELREAQREMMQVKKLAPQGASDVQREWIVEDKDGDWAEDSEADDDESMMTDDDDEDGSDYNEDKLYGAPEEMDADDTKSVTAASTIGGQSVRFDLGEDVFDQADFDRYQDARSHERYPDEIDTPARSRASDYFQAYRGLASFRTSPWDPYEDLPYNYARLYRFKDFDHFKKVVKSMPIDAASRVESGTFVTIHLVGVEESYVKNHDPAKPLTMFSLFPNEQKMSVVHFKIKKTEDEAVVANMDKLVFHVGFRKFTASALFSENTFGNKYKMLRYMPNEGFFIASVYAPITFPPSNVLVYREGKEDDGPVATGILSKVDPDRVVVERVVLSGHPFKVNKKTAVVRYMFFNPDDVEYFKQVELRTKYGKRGHIKYHVGTHGLMKCVFNGQLTSQDTVLLCLYKRVFPLWNYAKLSPATDGDNEAAMEDNDGEGGASMEM